MPKQIKTDIKEEETLSQEDNELRQELDSLGGEEGIIGQVQKEYDLCYEFMRPKVEEWLTRLTVYNNQRRKKESIGDPLLFTVFQTILASLYDDKLNVSFSPREVGDEETAENLKLTAEFDYYEMKKAELDFEWDWDTLFFGNGLLLFQEFDREQMHPVPEVMDPCTFLRDPSAVGFNGDAKGNNAARFWGREVAQTKYNLENNPDYFNVDNLKVGKDLNDLLVKMKQKRRDAQGLSDVNNKEDELGKNAEYSLLEWYTHLNGKKYLVTLGNSKTEVVRLHKIKGDLWPAINRRVFPTSHDWDGVSIPDMVEDKQRAKAILQNLGLKSAKSDVYPMYMFNEDRIKNKSDLHFGFNKFIRVKGEGSVNDAIQPMNKPVVHQQVSWIMDVMDQSAQRALATPEIQQGMSQQGASTLGEIELISAKVDTRYSLSAKVFGWSEAYFWQNWYMLYKEHFKSELDKKMIRLAGVWGPEVRKLTKENLITKVDPDIEIESKILAESKRLQERNAFTGYYGIIVNNPEANRRYADKELARLNGLTSQQIKILFPDTLDETEATMENELMEKNKMARVEMEQDHQAHIIVHMKLSDSKMRDEHIDTHSKAMYLLRKNQMMQGANIGRQPIEMPNESVPEQGGVGAGQGQVQPQPNQVAGNQGANPSIPQSYQKPQAATA